MKESDFKDLYLSNVKFCYKIVYGITNNANVTEDITHEVFCSIYQNYKTKNDIINEKSLIKTIAVRKSIDYIIRERKNKQVPVEATNIENLYNKTNDASSMEEQFEQKELKATIIRQIQELPDEHRLVLLLYYYHGYKYKEISKLLNISIGTVKSRLFSAKRKMQEKMRLYYE